MSINKQATGIPLNAYYYNSQLRKYILQFMAIFSGLQVSVGRRKTNDTTTTEDCDGNTTTEPVYEEPRLISVPIQYGGRDRVVASLFAENTQNKVLRLPTMSAMIRGLAFNPQYTAGQKAGTRHTYVPTGGLIPDDIQVVHRIKPVPYTMKMELGVYSSNTDQHFQIMEQILMMFDPQLQIQTNDSLFDWTKITHVMLDDISMDQNYPVGNDRRIIQSTITFTMPIWFSAPAEVKNEFVEKIFARVGAVSDLSSSEQIIAELDSQGIDYELLWDTTQLSFK